MGYLNYCYFIVVFILLLILKIDIIYCELLDVYADKPNENIDRLSECLNIQNSDFLTTQQIDFICQHRQMWYKDRDSKISKEFIPETTGQFHFLNL